VSDGIEELKAYLGLQTPKAEPTPEKRLYNPAVVGKLSTEQIEARLAAAKHRYDTEYAGKSFRAYYQQEGQLQALKSVQFWTQVKRHRDAGLV
jgi:hypothetical protein